MAQTPSGVPLWRQPQQAAGLARSVSGSAPDAQPSTAKEPAWHRRERRERAARRLLARVTAAAVQLARHHGSACPAVLRPLLTAVTPPGQWRPWADGSGDVPGRPPPPARPPGVFF